MSSTSTQQNTLVALETVHCSLPEFVFPSDENWKIKEYEWTAPETVGERIKEATIIVTATCKIDSAKLSPDVTPNLRMIQVMGTGTNHIDLDAAKARGIRVCNTPSANIESVSEHAIALYFAARRRVVMLHNATTDFGHDGTQIGQWKSTGSLGHQLVMSDGTMPLLCSEETMGIIGYGVLGKRVEAKAKALGMTVLIAERKGSTPRTASSSTTDQNTRVPFEEVLKRSTVLVICCPLSKDTMNMISTEEFKSMSPYALLINVARGGIVDEHAVLTALKQGSIAGVGTDVFAVEPAGHGDSPLLSEEAKGLNITVSPHVAWCARKTLENLRASWKKTIEAWFRGEDINVIV